MVEFRKETNRIRKYILELPQDVFDARLMPISRTEEYKKVRSLALPATINDAAPDALRRLRDMLADVMQIPLESDDDVCNAAFAISARIINSSKYFPGVGPRHLTHHS